MRPLLILIAMTSAVALSGLTVQEAHSAANDASYFCAAELTAGIAYNVQAKQWFSF